MSGETSYTLCEFYLVGLMYCLDSRMLQLYTWNGYSISNTLIYEICNVSRNTHPSLQQAHYNGSGQFSAALETQLHRIVRHQDIEHSASVVTYTALFGGCLNYTYRVIEKVSHLLGKYYCQVTLNCKKCVRKTLFLASSVIECLFLLSCCSRISQAFLNKILRIEYSRCEFVRTILKSVHSMAYSRLAWLLGKHFHLKSSDMLALYK